MTDRGCGVHIVGCEAVIFNRVIAITLRPRLEAEGYRMTLQRLSSLGVWSKR
jgi:hypothetical protein